MDLKFEKLVKSILGEGIGDPESAKHFSGGKEKRGEHEKDSSHESEVAPESVKKADRNHGEKSHVSFNRWTVKDPKTGKTYTFAANKSGASLKAEMLAKKLGSKAIWRSKHH
jgi:hypothetical protein